VKKDKKTKEEKNCRLGKVGGEAVIEGLMMRSGDRMSTACRNEEGKIVVVDKKHVSLRKRHKFFNIPILRGVINFIESMVMSFGVLEVSAEIMGDVAVEETKFEKWLKKTFGKSIFDVIMFIAGALGIALAVLLFTYLPNQVALWTERLFHVSLGIWKAVLCGVLRIIIFILYIVLVSLMKDIRRTFEYHGAEHKTIACYEAGDELTPENAKRHSRFHPRCGTSFMFVMLFLSIVVSLAIRYICELVIGWDFAAITLAATGKDLSALIYTGIGILTLPIVVGIGFEFLMFAGKHPNAFTRFLSAPGLWMQRLTTREPDESQLEVAIIALKCAMPEEFPDFDRDTYLIRDEYNHPPVKGKKKDTAKETAEATETVTETPAAGAPSEEQS
jgi:uncharacterized protein YqhQ